MGAAILFLLLFHPWKLSYTCDSGLGNVGVECNYSHNGWTKRFASKQKAIDWVEARPQFAPWELKNGSIRFDCEFKYTDGNRDYFPDDWRKTVDCDTRANLDKKYCPEGCIWFD